MGLAGLGRNPDPFRPEALLLHSCPPGRMTGWAFYHPPPSLPGRGYRPPPQTAAFLLPPTACAAVPTAAVPSTRPLLVSLLPLPLRPLPLHPLPLRPLPLRPLPLRPLPLRPLPTRTRQPYACQRHTPRPAGPTRLAFASTRASPPPPRPCLCPWPTTLQVCSPPGGSSYHYIDDRGSGGGGGGGSSGGPSGGRSGVRSGGSSGGPSGGPRDDYTSRLS